MDWLDRYNALLEPTDMEAAMRDEIDMALAAILAAGVTPSSAAILRVVSNAQSSRLTAARICLVQSVCSHGEGTRLSFQRLLSGNSLPEQWANLGLFTEL